MSKVRGDGGGKRQRSDAALSVVVPSPSEGRKHAHEFLRRAPDCVELEAVIDCMEHSFPASVTGHQGIKIIGYLRDIGVAAFDEVVCIVIVTLQNGIRPVGMLIPRDGICRLGGGGPSKVFNGLVLKTVMGGQVPFPYGSGGGGTRLVVAYLRESIDFVS